ncbi:MAG TPA: hypothetical protein VFJ51_10025 [Nitrososphaeraceae archaeon]|nr:hypothetical protein [Nitrososphaeraceae archaeon]
MPSIINLVSRLYLLQAAIAVVMRNQRFIGRLGRLGALLAIMICCY